MEWESQSDVYGRVMTCDKVLCCKVVTLPSGTVDMSEKNEKLCVWVVFFNV